MNISKFKIAAWTSIGLGIISLIIIGWIYKDTSFISNSLEFDEPSSNLTASIGAILSGTVGVFFSLAAVMFFIVSLKEQQASIKNNQLTIERQQFENTFFSLLKYQGNVRDKVNSPKPDADYNRIFLPGFSINDKIKPSISYKDFSQLFELFKNFSGIVKFLNHANMVRVDNVFETYEIK